MKSRSESLPPELGSTSTKSSRNTPLVEGDRKAFFISEHPDVLIQEFKSNGTENGKKGTRKSPIASAKNDITSYVFEYIEGFHIPTHFIRRLSETEMLVRQLDILPLTVRVFNHAVGDLGSRFAFQEGSTLEVPVFEHYVRTSAGLSWVNEFHCSALGLLTPDEFKQINRISSKVNAVLRSLCSRRGLALANMRLSFGRHKGNVCLAGDFTPDTMTLWDVPLSDPSSKMKFAPGGENEHERHLELLRRLSLKS